MDLDEILEVGSSLVVRAPRSRKWWLDINPVWTEVRTRVSTRIGNTGYDSPGGAVYAYTVADNVENSYLTKRQFLYLLGHSSYTVG
jgi:hypothetical protein